MDVTYKREMKHNYLIVETKPEVYGSYEAKMIVSNRIEGFLKTSMKLVDNRLLFYYEITSKQPLFRLLDQHNITAGQIRRLVIGISNALNHLETYLLIEDQILIQPEFIYVEPEEYMIWLCFVPGIKGNFAKDLCSLFQYILGKVDHQDKDSVVLAYGLYQESIKENYVIDDLLKLVSMNSNYDFKESNHKTELCSKDKVILEEPEAFLKQAESDNKEMYHISMPMATKSLGKNSWKNKITLLTLFIIGGPLIICLLAGTIGLKKYGIWLLVLDLAAIILSVIPLKYEDREKENSTKEHSVPLKDNIKNLDRKMIYNEELEESESIKSGKLIRGGTEVIGNVLPSATNLTSQDTVLLTSSKNTPNARYLMSLDKEIENIPVIYFPFIIGKQEGLVDYVLNKDVVSRLHVRFDFENEIYYITDLNSTNGTTVQGRLLETNETISLQPGDHVYIANVGYVFT